MPSPLLSFVVPAHRSGAALVARFLRSLAYQTADKAAFEVVIGCDGGGLEAFIIPADLGFDVVLINSKRTKALPHRNHARNAALREARGKWCWVVDSDFIWAPNAVAEAIRVMSEAEARGELLAVTPILIGIEQDPVVWRGQTESWVLGDETTSVGQIIGSVKTTHNVYSGFGNRIGKGTKGLLEVPSIAEGFPLAPKAVFEALDGFDKRFIGWGGNKEELCRRLGALEDCGLKYKVLTSVRGWHQPHKQDRAKTTADTLRRANQAMFTDRMQQMGRGESWWVEQKAAIRRVAVATARRGLPGKPRRAATEPAGAAKVGLVCMADPRKGITRDMKMLAELLDGGPMRRNGQPDPTVSWYELKDVHTFRQASPSSAAGRRFIEWAKAQDVIVLSETLPMSIKAACAVTRVVYIPNADWAEVAGSVPKWFKLLRSVPTLEVWSKSPALTAVLTKANIRAVDVPWVATTEVARERPTPSGPIRFFASLGMGGWKRRRGADIIVEAWKLLNATPEEAVLTIKTVHPLAKQIDGPTPANIELIEADWTRAQIDASWLEHDVVLHPSRWEGFGIPLSEALNAGCAVIATDAAPMSEQVTPGHDGLLVGGKRHKKTRLADYIEVSPAKLAAAMRLLIDDRPKLRRMMAPQPGLRLAKQHAFRMFVRQHLLAEPAPLVIIGAGENSHPDERRSEQFWTVAVKRLGYSVAYILTSQLRGMGPMHAVDFAIAPKFGAAQVDMLRRIAAGAPVVLWHHDLCDFSTRRLRWMKKVSPLCDLVMIPEDGTARFGGHCHTLMPGTKAHNATQPTHFPGDVKPDIVFMGSAMMGSRDERVRTIKALHGAGHAVQIAGDDWKGVGLKAEPYLTGPKVWARYLDRVALCSSRGGHQRFYTSNRIFSAGGAGAALLVHTFPGLDRLYPEGVITFTDPSAVRLDDHDLTELARQAWQCTWRRHTWEDRIIKMVEHVNALDMSPERRRAPGGFWDTRAQKHGARSVSNLGWTAHKLAQVTDVAWRSLERQIKRARKPHECRVLDFGCGAGRFTAKMAAMPGADVTGVDSSPAMVELATRAAPGVDFRTVYDRLPFADNSFHVVVTTMTLQHIRDADLSLVTSELRRVAKPGALFCLLELTDQKQPRIRSKGLTTVRRELEYRQAFPGVMEAETVMLGGEAHSMMAGRAP